MRRRLIKFIARFCVYQARIHARRAFQHLRASERWLAREKTVLTWRGKR